MSTVRHTKSISRSRSTRDSRSRSTSNSRSLNLPPPPVVEPDDEILDPETVVSSIQPELLKMMQNMNSNLTFLAGKVKELEKKGSRSRSNSTHHSAPTPTTHSRNVGKSRSRSRSRSPVRRSRSRSRGRCSRSSTRSVMHRSRSREFSSSPAPPASRVMRDRPSLNVSMESSGRKVTSSYERESRSTHSRSQSRVRRDSKEREKESRVRRDCKKRERESRVRRDCEKEVSRVRRDNENESRVRRGCIDTTRNTSRSRSRSISPQSIISLRANSKELEIVENAENIEDFVSKDILDIVNEELDVDHFGPPINDKLSKTINKKLDLEFESPEELKNKLKEIKIPQNINAKKLTVPTMNTELLAKNVGLDRFARRNDNRLSNLQLLTNKSNNLIIQSTDLLYSNINKVDGEVKEALNQAVKIQTETVGYLAHVKKELSKLRRNHLYQNLPKDIRGICFEKIEEDDELLFGNNIKEKMKEVKSNHFKTPFTFRSNNFLGRRIYQKPPNRTTNKYSHQNQYQKAKKSWHFSKRK